MRSKYKSEFLHMRVDPQTKAEIIAGAKRRGITISDYIRDLVRQQTFCDIANEGYQSTDDIKKELNKRFGYNPYQE